MEAASVGDGLNNETAEVEESGEVRDLESNCLREPLLLKRHRMLSSSPLSMVGAKVAHIESLNYEMSENDLFKQDWRRVVQYVNLKWKMAFLIGLLTGLIATLINLAVENVSGYKLLLVSNCIQSERYVEGFVYLVGANFMLTLMATVLCVCFAPTAAGPGIPEIKAYLNGIDTPNMYGAPTLIVKVCLLACLVRSSQNLAATSL